jgi:DnaJ-class molecular chaperone
MFLQNSYIIMPNHYETLGVSKDASEKEIKQAFRALSMKFHPDKVKSKTAEEQEEANRKMQEINSANEVLSDEQQRQMYDMELNGQGGPFGGQGGPFGGQGGPFGNPFGQGGPFGPFAQGQNVHFAQGPGVNIFEMLFGGQGGPNIEIHGLPGGMFFQRHIQKPQPIVKDVNITLKQAYTGIPFKVEIERWIQEGDLRINENETLHINIPQGIDAGESIVLQDSGNIINMNGKTVKGDVQLNIHITNETEFTRNKNDLHYKKTITLKEALCGFKLKIEHLNGNQLGLNVNVVVFTGAKQCFKNLGMVREGVAGNLILEFEVKFPESLTPEQKEALNNIL